MLVRDIYNKLNQISPFELQESWDNSGLIVGDFDNEIQTVYLSLDLDLDLVDELAANSLIITHHPLIFKPLKQLIPVSYEQKIAIKLIQKNISLISMHTNFDKTHLNKYVMSEVLGFEGIQSDDFVLSANVDMDFDEFVKYIKARFNLTHITTVQSHHKVRSFSLTTGSGMSLLPSITTDVFLTGDIKYHEAMQAKARNISLIDITHYASEQYFPHALSALLHFDTQIVTSHNPFVIK
ncbi:MAG: Nif3-like dinuclear metal center hexameric protein [Epsilonproteobacteria bacterium]|nr:Nif3-like dinuclear metal center hexameric protein [Campylobacterota bacterium]